MKRKQFLTLLCVVATSVCFAMPVMAKEDVSDQTMQESIESQEESNVLPTEKEDVQNSEL